MKRYLEHTETDRDAGASALVLIRFEPGKASVRRALRLLATCALEVLVAARNVDGTHAPAQVASREADGARWNG